MGGEQSRTSPQTRDSITTPKNTVATGSGRMVMKQVCFLESKYSSMVLTDKVLDGRCVMTEATTVPENDWGQYGDFRKGAAKLVQS